MLFAERYYVCVQLTIRLGMTREFRSGCGSCVDRTLQTSTCAELLDIQNPLRFQRGVLFRFEISYALGHSYFLTTSALEIAMWTSNSR